MCDPLAPSDAAPCQGTAEALRDQSDLPTDLADDQPDPVSAQARADGVNDEVDVSAVNEAPVDGDDVLVPADRAERRVAQRQQRKVSTGPRRSPPRTTAHPARPAPASGWAFPRPEVTVQIPHGVAR
jgi:hypothetical protein